MEAAHGVFQPRDLRSAQAHYVRLRPAAAVGSVVVVQYVKFVLSGGWIQTRKVSTYPKQKVEVQEIRDVH